MSIRLRVSSTDHQHGVTTFARSSRIAFWAIGLTGVIVGVVALVSYQALRSFELEFGIPTADGDAYPAWSPDGTRIAFQRDLESTGNQVYVVEVEGGEPERLTTDDYADEGQPSWSPDGGRIVFVSNELLTVMESDGTNVTPLRGDFGSCCPAWSPDGEEIVYASGDLYVVDASGGRTRRLTRTKGLEHAPAWSPDGKTIAYGCGRVEGICLVRRDGTGAKRISKRGREPAWAPDGERLAVAWDEGFKGGLSIIDRRGAVLARLVPDVIAGNPAWSPGGSQIAFDAGGHGELFIVNADGTGLARLSQP